MQHRSALLLLAFVLAILAMLPVRIALAGPAPASSASAFPVILTGPPAVPSTLRSATVYRSGAELTHTASATLQQGNNDLIIEDISNTIDEGSIRVSCKENVTIMSVSFSTEFLKPESASPAVRRLQDSIEAIKKQQVSLNVLIKSNNELLDLLGANKTIGGANTGLTVAELSKMVDYYKEKVIGIRTELSACNEKLERLDQLVEKLQNQVREEEKKNSKTSGRLLLQLQAPSAGAFEFTVSYLTLAAHWNPFYDLRVDNVSDPLHIFYKAKIVQTSGIDWKKVKLSLSTSMPSQSGNAPLMKSWFLRFFEPEPLAALEGRVPGLAFSKSNNLDEVVVTRGYGAMKRKASDKDAFKKEYEMQDYISVNDNQMDVTFDIDLPYDVPGNGKEQGVVLKEYKVPCVYRDYAAPCLDKDAYLLGEIPQWEKLNLLPGEANIMVEGTYIGKSYIDPGSTVDTLKLTLGRDKRVVVKKEKITDYSSVKFLGSNKKQLFAYEITVRNNKNDKVSLLLKDQYPLSSDKDIEIELLDSSGAAVDSDTGFLAWALTLAPGETKKFKVSYSVKYPKDKTVNIN